MFDFSQSDTAPEPSVPKKSLTYVLQVVDASSSMTHGLDITKSTYNELNQVIAKAAKEENSEIKVSLIKFSDDVKTVYENVDASELSPLTNDNYVPEGMTALYDAIGKAIQMARKFPQDEDTAFLLQILTDGGENCSKEFKANILKSMIEEVNATNKWTITIAGPQGSIDLFAQSMSIHAGNVTSFNPGSLESRFENKDMMLRGIQGYFGPQGPRGARGPGGQSMNSTQSFYSSVAQTTSPTGEPMVDNKTSSQ